MPTMFKHFTTIFNYIDSSGAALVEGLIFYAQPEILMFMRSRVEIRFDATLRAAATRLPLR